MSETAPAIAPETPPRPFIHLHCHSEYSVLDGAGSLKRLVDRAVELRMDALALTDHGNLFGSLKFYKQAVGRGLKPILGYEAYVAPGHRTQRTGQAGSSYHLTLLSMNRTGFQNLLRLASLAYLEGMYYKPRIDRELLERYGDGLIVLSGCLGGEVNQHLIGSNEPRWDEARKVVEWYRNLFGDRYYLEIQNNGLELQRLSTRHLIALSAETGVPLVATSDVHYVLPEDAATQDILLCINTGKLRAEENRMKMDTDEFFFRDQEQMYAAFPGQAEAVARSQEIADRCNLELELGKRFFPVYNPPEGMDSVAFLRQIAEEGLRKRYAKTPKRWKDGVVGGEFSEEVAHRLDTELGVVERQGFPNYFLVVWDFVREAHERGILCTARGSGVGSLVCFGLGLSQVCPLEYDLLFERFLDVNRAEAPDIDIDFEQARREEVLQYVRDTYGAENVAQIGTFGTMAAKAAIKDVGRVLGFSISTVESVTSKIPNAPKIKIAMALDQNPELREQVESNPEIAEMVELARGCEGLARQAGTHACGVLITPEPVVNFVPLHKIKHKSDVVTQWEGAEVEASGLLKMDFLGLRNLSILAQTMNFIEQTTGRRLDPNDFPLDDKESYALLCRGETKGVFQLEGEGIRGLLQRMRPDNFRDIIATLALYRPGPLDGGMVDTYINVKHGKAKADYVHPVMKEILEETHGVMVYQEQIMRILNRLGKIELASAYKCIKAISKKKHDMINMYRSKFIEGCRENDLGEKDADALFELIVKFAGYGFNKSHSTAYAKIALITAYLKAHYPVEFMAALLTGDILQRNFRKKDKTVEHLEDCQRMNVQVVQPDVNTSGQDYRIEDGKIYFALNAISGCNEAVAAAIRRERVANGPYTDIFDFCKRVAHERIPRATLLTLLEAGAFDSFGAHRAQIEAVLEKAFLAGESSEKDRVKGQLSLFDEIPEEQSVAVELPDVPEWPEKDRLNREKKVLGYYRSGHPLSEFRELLQRHCTHKTSQAAELKHRTPVVMGGIISALEKRTTKQSGEMYARFALEDEEGTVATVVWPKTYAKCAEAVLQDTVVVCVGTIDNPKQEEEAKAAKKAQEATEKAAKAAKYGSKNSKKQALVEEDDDLEDDELDTLPGEDPDSDGADTVAGGGGVRAVTLLVDRIVTIDSLRRDFNNGMTACVHEGTHDAQTLKTLKEILRAFPGSEPFKLAIRFANGMRVECDTNVTLTTTPELVERVRQLLGPENVSVQIRVLKPEAREKKFEGRKWSRGA